METNLFPDSKIGFDTTLLGLTAFMQDFDKHLSEIKPGIPVYFLNTGDETYYNFRFKRIEDNNEIYKQNPRVVFKIDTVETPTEGKNRFNQIQYAHNKRLYSAQSQKIHLNIPLICNFVTPNFIYGMQYFELLLTIFNAVNSFTYKSMENTYVGGYDAKTYNFEFPPSGASSEQRNFIINYTLNLNLPIYVSDYKTIKELNPVNRLPITDANPAGSDNINTDTYTPVGASINSKESANSKSGYKTDISQNKCDT